MEEKIENKLDKQTPLQEQAVLWEWLQRTLAVVFSPPRDQSVYGPNLKVIASPLLLDWLQLKSFVLFSVDKGLGETKTLIPCWWESKWMQTFWKRTWLCLSKFKMHICHDQAIPLLRMLPTVGKKFMYQIFVEDYMKQQNIKNNSNDLQWGNDSIICTQWNALQWLKIIRKFYALVWKYLQALLLKKMQNIVCILVNKIK